MNPLLDTSALPRFGDIEPDDALPAIEQLIAAHRQKLADLLRDDPPHAFDELVPPLEEMAHEFGRVWSPIGHLHSVSGDSGWRKAYNDCLGLVTEYFAELGQNPDLQKAFETIEAELDDETPPERRKIVENSLRDFRLAGVALPEEEKAEFRDLRQQLAGRQATFEQHVQDATDAWHLSVGSEKRLAGLPRQVVERASRDAEEAGHGGWRLSLDYPTYQAVMTHADDTELRQIFYRAWATRASDQGEHPEWDNAGAIEDILSLRHRLARLVGYDNYADYSLATKMAGSTSEVIDFLHELASRSRATAQSEMDSLEALAGRPVEARDVAYYLEKLRESEYSVSDELLRQYFPVRRVIAGMFRLAERLYQIRVRPVKDVAAWHETVVYYRVDDADGKPIGGFYADLHARSGKRSGAWIDECVVRKNMAGDTALPVGYLVCNFLPPDESGVSLMTHNEVVTLFHEFGHMLHHLLTRVDYPSIAGINGVPWDAVEMPSQFMENFAWTYEVLSDASGQFRTGEAIPRELFDKLAASRYCGAGLAMLRQLEFALFDIRIHASYDPEAGARTLETLERVRSEIAVVRHPEFNRFPMSFGHIFSGGYAAGYYSYKWAEVLAADAFSAFEEQGLFDPGTAARFRAEILEVGGSRDIMQAFVAFRGRKPKLDALLRQSGIDLAA
ncbi:MAG: M3 family metallopeptidase [Woeseiaceae bacterium]|nr:M3 family metallopeptidase [Woeseiaceae bacterium]